MTRRRNNVVWPHLNDGGGNLDKTWYVEYSLRNPNNKMERFRHYDGFKDINSIKERVLYAKKLIEELTEKIKSGEIGFSEMVEYEDFLTYGGNNYFSKKKKTLTNSFKFYISDFIEYKKLEINTKTLQTYRSKFRIFVAFLESKNLSDKPVSMITNELIIEFLKVIVTERGLSRKSVEKYQQIIHTFFSYLIDIKHCEIGNPVLNIPRLGTRKDEAPAAIPREMRIQLQNIIKPNDPQLWMSICFIYYSAIRPGTELRLMKLNQINYDSRTCVIRNYLAKNGRTEVVDIPDQLYALIIEEWKLQNYDQELYIFGDGGLPGTQPLGKNAMRMRFNTFRNRLKLPEEIKYYSWKHSGAQELADQGISIYELQRHLRHRDITTTEQYLKKRIGQKSNAIKHHFPSI